MSQASLFSFNCGLPKKWMAPQFYTLDVFSCHEDIELYRIVEFPNEVTIEHLKPAEDEVIISDMLFYEFPGCCSCRKTQKWNLTPYDKAPPGLEREFQLWFNEIRENSLYFDMYLKYGPNENSLNALYNAIKEGCK